jgi:hypothetical protein
MRRRRTEVRQEPELEPGGVSQQRRCAMVNVKLPLAYRFDDDNDNHYHSTTGNDSATGNVSNSSPYPRLEQAIVRDVVDWMEAVMANQYKTMVPVFDHGGWLWVRLSAQIYLEKSDFEWLGGVLKGLCDRVRKNQMHVELRGQL